MMPTILISYCTSWYVLQYIWLSLTKFDFIQKYEQHNLGQSISQTLFYFSSIFTLEDVGMRGFGVYPILFNPVKYPFLKIH
jgi:hypothetical protein